MSAFLELYLSALCILSYDLIYAGFLTARLYNVFVSCIVHDTFMKRFVRFSGGTNLLVGALLVEDLLQSKIFVISGHSLPHRLNVVSFNYCSEQRVGWLPG